MVVPYPAGGPTDAVGRIIAQGLQNALGHPVIIENVGGAAANLGTERVARATPDGYTIGLGNSVTHVVNAAIYPLKYDVVKDFEPISLLATEPVVIVGRPTLPASNLRELIAWLKDNSGKSLAGTAGVGSVADVALYFLEKKTGTSIQHIPYHGLAPAVEALMSGEIDLIMSLPGNVLGQVKAGTIKAFAVTAKARLTGDPDITRPWTKPASKAFINRTGTRLSHRKERRKTSLQNLTPPPSRPSLTRKFANGWWRMGKISSPPTN